VLRSDQLQLFVCATGSGLSLELLFRRRGADWLMKLVNKACL
jgi:hypothetical protein